ncbi:hypothetical protein [Flavobacterium sp. I3-2]|uniref:hypothetical protein n=1 Tax=Flavobacterium sp. I3-2 TaxID=2748319 RepID=UPI0015ACEA99|nr:hypothetical protein [Flavobacterium sp. I3-2]
MKNLFLIFALLISCTLTVQAQNVIGKISDGKYVITMDTNEIKLAGEALLTKQGITARLTRFEILQDRVDGAGDIYYFLLAQTDDNSIKLATTLSLKNGSFYPEGNYLFSGSITCSGCSRGCNPRHEKSSDGITDWYCTACAKGTVGGCTKTVTMD